MVSRLRQTSKAEGELSNACFVFFSSQADYDLLTFTSQDTIERARNTGAELLASDTELVEQCQVILSVLPPKDADATAQRVIDALSGSEHKDDIYYVDLNAISPASTKALARRFEKARTPIKFIDGCILGGPPQQKSSAKNAILAAKTQNDNSD